jgi:hypothetical protein
MTQQPSRGHGVTRGPRLDILPRMKADDLRRLAEQVPSELRDRPIWVACDRTPRERTSGRRVSSKIPLWTGGNADTTNPATWLSFADAAAFALADDRVATLGICLEGQKLVVLDLDHVLTYDEHTDSYECAAAAKAFLKRLPPSYVEVSPGRDGLHVVFQGSVPSGWRKQARDAFGPGMHLECYSAGRYVTMTGDSLAGPTLAWLQIEDPPAVLREILEVDEDSYGDSARDPVDAETVYAALKAIDASLPYEDWIAVGMALHRLLGPDEGLRAWDDWSASAPDSYDGELLPHWRSFSREADRSRRPGFGTLARLADSHSGSPEWRPRPPMLLEPVATEKAAKAAEAIPLYMSGDQLRAWVGSAEFLVANVLPKSGLFQLFGAPGSGKSLIALSLAVAVAAEDETWMGHEVNQHGPVAVLVGEDLVGVAARFEAECQIRGLKASEVPVVFSTKPTQLLDAAQMQTHGQAIIDKLGSVPVLVIVDTYATNYGAGSEDSTEDASIAMANAAALQREFGCLLGFCHHSSKGNASTGRGSSVFLAALDAEFMVAQRQTAPSLASAQDAFSTGEEPSAPRPTGTVVTVTPKKAKNWQRVPAWSAEITAVPVGLLKTGDIEWAAVASYAPTPPVGEEAIELFSEHDQAHLQVVLEYIADQTAKSNLVTASQLFSKFGELVGWPGRTAFRSWLQSCIDMKFVKSIGKTRSRRLELTKEGRAWLASKIL